MTAVAVVVVVLLVVVVVVVVDVFVILVVAILVAESHSCVNAVMSEPLYAEPMNETPRSALHPELEGLP